MVVDHGAHFTTTVRATHAEARERLGLPADRTLLVMIGFLSPSDPDKGYDRAIAAARAVPDVELHIVGSPIREAPEVDALLAQLRAAAREPRIHLHEGFVDDEAFDLWLRAADAVLTPYRTGSSSGVLARARLLGTPFVTSDAGGLAEQAGPDDFVVRDDAELIAAVRALAARGTGARRRR
jgi:glycosyltransferase involved in cell wall biosynthesis